MGVKAEFFLGGEVIGWDSNTRGRIWRSYLRIIIIKIIMNFIIIVISYPSGFLSSHPYPALRNNDTPIKAVVCFASRSSEEKDFFKTQMLRRQWPEVLKLWRKLAMLRLYRKKSEEFVAVCNLSLSVLIITRKLHRLLCCVECYIKKISYLPTPSVWLKYNLLLLECVPFRLHYKRVVNWGKKVIPVVNSVPWRHMEKYNFVNLDTSRRWVVRFTPC